MADGMNFWISDQLVGRMEKYVCTFYGFKDGNVNQARYNLFGNTTEEVTGSKFRCSYTAHEKS